MPEAIDETLRLRVTEALPRDAGRGLARLDPQDMAALGVNIGDIVEVGGKRAAAAKVMPAYVEDRGQGALRLDGILRENVRSSVGDEVRLRKASWAPAATLILAPVAPAGVPSRALDPQHLRRLLEGLVVVPGDKVRATLLGNRHAEFHALEASPKGVVMVGPATVLRIAGETAAAKAEEGVTYEDIGGLHKEVQRLREMVELPLKYPELFERLGIEPPRGVLLHGPPGCGKTLIARAIAHETQAYFTSISAPEIITKFYGESEARLRALFDTASQHAPAIIFIDEIDAIASKREEVRGDQQVERRVVAQLLALLDGLKARGQVVVIGATNLPQVVDPALRRPGRFDRELAIGAPDQNGRQEVLQVHTRGMPLAGDVALERLAEITHGFVGADLAALCREAAMNALRRLLPRLDPQARSVPGEMLEELVVGMDDFRAALREVEPSAIREFFTEIPRVRWNEVGGLGEAKAALAEAVEWPLKHSDVFGQVGVVPPKGILLSGPPGTGKTLLAKAVASESGVNFISVKGPALMSKWVGESERAIREVFKKARQASPCIIFFDELDALTPRRGLGGDSQATERVVSQFLTELDGIEELRSVLVLAATNRPDMLDPALLRPGRFDLHLELPAPDEAGRLAILQIHCQGKPLAADVDLAKLAGATPGLVGADLAALCNRAALAAVREHLQQPPAPAGPPAVRISAQHFEQALVSLRR
ncbi:MAG: CDC48 family AAA ATPase [Chloroflexi bacterium]|nr:CDC48 family AAA ATPase [Chloroflexota bacterium]